MNFISIKTKCANYPQIGLHRFNTIAVKIPEVLFTETDKLILKYIERQRTQNRQTIFKKKTNTEEPILGFLQTI